MKIRPLKPERVRSAHVSARPEHADAERRARCAYASPADDQALCFIAVALTVRRRLLWRREILPIHKYHTNRLVSCRLVGIQRRPAPWRRRGSDCDGYAPAVSS